MCKRFRLQKLRSGKVRYFPDTCSLIEDFDFASVELARIFLVQYGAVLVRKELHDVISGVYEYPTVCESDVRTAISDDIEVGNFR